MRRRRAGANSLLARSRPVRTASVRRRQHCDRRAGLDFRPGDLSRLAVLHGPQHSGSHLDAPGRPAALGEGHQALPGGAHHPRPSVARAHDRWAAVPGGSRALRHGVICQCVPQIDQYHRSLHARGTCNPGILFRATLERVRLDADRMGIELSGGARHATRDRGGFHFDAFDPARRGSGKYPLAPGIAAVPGAGRLMSATASNGGGASTGMSRSMSEVRIVDAGGPHELVTIELFDRLGYLEQMGIKALKTYVKNGAEATEILLAGRADVAIQVGFGPALAAIANGAPLRIVAGSNLLTVHAIYSKDPNIRS